MSKQGNDSHVYIGKKRTMNYVLAAMVNLGSKKPVRLCARGQAINRAIDVAEILKNRYMSGATYGEIKISTEEITNKDGTNSNVSAMEIELLPPK